MNEKSPGVLLDLYTKLRRIIMGRKIVCYLSGIAVLVFVLSGLMACSGGGGVNGVMTPPAK